MVELRGAIVTRSKNVKTAIEIETGALVSTKGIEKRTYIFTPEIEEKGLKKDMDEVCLFVCAGHEVRYVINMLMDVGDRGC